jgi:hypothetical protein
MKTPSIWEKRNEEEQINGSILHWEEEGTEMEKRFALRNSFLRR